MGLNQVVASLLLRLALATGFLSAVASRLGLWGKYSSGWNNFVSYTAQINSFAHRSMASTIAVISTILELTLGIMLLVGFKTSYAALATGSLTLAFALAMSFSSGIKSEFISHFFY